MEAVLRRLTALINVKIGQKCVVRGGGGSGTRAGSLGGGWGTLKRKKHFKKKKEIKKEKRNVL